MSFRVYQFTETLETCVLPTSWVIEGQVKYDSKKASEYAKKGKTPYKKWPTYKVEPLCAKLFGKSNSYDAAYRAESLLLEKSDLESTDIEAINNPSQILGKKRIRHKIVLSTDASDLSSSEGEIATLKLPPLNTTIITKADIHTNDNSNENNNGDMRDDIKINNETVLDIPMNTNEIDVITNINDVQMSLSTESQVNELKELIIAQNRKIDNLTALVTNMSKQLKKIKRDSDSYYDGKLTTVTRWQFPLKTLEDLKELEESLKNEENGSLNEFKSYLLQLGGTTLKMTVKIIIQEMYSLDLQQKLNYTGRENKFATRNLIQTKLILEVMQRNASKTQVEAINEYMYHLQHVTNRIRRKKIEQPII